MFPLVLTKWKLVKYKPREAKVAPSIKTVGFAGGDVPASVYPCGRENYFLKFSKFFYRASLLNHRKGSFEDVLLPFAWDVKRIPLDN